MCKYNPPPHLPLSSLSPLPPKVCQRRRHFSQPSSCLQRSSGQDLKEGFVTRVHFNINWFMTNSCSSRSTLPSLSTWLPPPPPLSLRLFSIYHLEMSPSILMCLVPFVLPNHLLLFLLLLLLLASCPSTTQWTPWLSTFYFYLTNKKIHKSTNSAFSGEPDGRLSHAEMNIFTVSLLP